MIVQISPPWGNAGAGSSRGSALATTLSAGEVPRSDPIGGIVVRQATISDMSEVESLIRHFAEHNLMLPKNYDDLARGFREFIVAGDQGGGVLACGALRVYGKGLAEVCSLAVAPAHQRTGLGGQVVLRLLENARELGIARVFALTLSPGFFGRFGFEIVPKDEFPQKVWADCRGCPKLHACDEIAVALHV